VPFPHPGPNDHESTFTHKTDVGLLFDDNAALYDRLNRVVGLGMGERYRGDVLRRAGLTPGMTVLDVGCGTGVLGAHARRLVGPTGRVIALDASHGMLGIARGKRGLEAVQAAAERLPFADASMDFVVMGYALRHLERLDPVFAEFARVLRPGGRLLMLELLPPRQYPLRHAFRAYLRKVVPWLVGRRGTERLRTRQLMDYTWMTITHAAPPPQVLHTLRANGFDDVQFSSFAQILGEYAARIQGNKAR
jgi:demethylmenaquinone methyltransferase / 2-methoxy-6-polyprenyl-1,4-benzoquinol methylase